MDTTQLLLSTAVTITTVLLIIVSVQLTSLLKQLKKDRDKESPHSVKDQVAHNNKIARKKINLTSLLKQMQNRITRIDQPKKRFFKSD